MTKEEYLKQSKLLKEFPTLESLMFENKKTIANHKKKKYFSEKRSFKNKK